MRGGICTVQQALTPEATTLVKQAVSLAKRRGHAQVTPLHVASAMLATSSGLLRKACIQCHSHPLQCKALELCFNVALNRLPASSPSPLLAPHYPNPSFSNALVAAFKRAQAHQRRGSVENQQQPILALKIEQEQLIISILDDPSVSRVMREAGFSSPQIKSRVEQAVSLEICSQNSSPVSVNNSQSKESVVHHHHHHHMKPLGLLPHHHSVQAITGSLMPSSAGQLFSVVHVPNKPFDHIRNEDVSNVLSVMMNKRKNSVILGECLGTAENVAKGVMESFERPGNNSSKYLQFINLPLFSLRNISKEEAEQKVIELRCLVKSYMGRSGVVLYLGDLTWVSEFWSSNTSGTTTNNNMISCPQQRRSSSSYFAMEQIIMELKRLVSSNHFGESSTRVWLMGISTFQNYIKCKQGTPSLEAIWELHPLTIPVGSLSLSLKFESDLEGDVSTTKASKDIIISDHEKHCVDYHCSCNNNVIDHKHNIIANSSSTVSSLPSWLQKYTEENKRSSSNSHQEYCITVGDLCKKWNTFSSPGQKHPHNFAEKPFNFSSLSPSTPFSSHDFNHTLSAKQSPKEYQFWALEKDNDDDDDDREPAKPELLSNPNSSPNSASSSEVEAEEDDDLRSFKELNAENLRILCDEMEKNVPWQKEIVPEIATTVLQCRSGMSQRKSNVLNKGHKKDESSWLFFLGGDSEGKEKIARTLARLIFGSRSNSFASIGLSGFSSNTSGDISESSKKRKRTSWDDEWGRSYVQRLAEAVNENPRRVFFMEDLDKVDQSSRKGIRNAIETGKIKLPCGETVTLKDSIFILSCESFGSGSRDYCSDPKRSSSSSPLIIPNSDHRDHGGDDEQSVGVSLDLNIAVLQDHDRRDDHGGHEDSDSINVGILESVDRKFVFKVSP